MTNEAEKLLIISNFYEKKLFEVLSKEEFDKIKHHAFRLLMVNDLMQYRSKEWSSFIKNILKMDNSEYETLCNELKELIPITIAAREECEGWNPDDDDGLLDYDEEIEDDDDFDI